MSFAKNIVKNIRNNYGQKPLDGAKKSMTDAIKTTSKRASQITAEATGDLIGNKIADKIKLQLKQICQMKNIYLQKKGNTLLRN